MGSLGPTELIIIFGIILLLFGAKKLPELARGLGRGIREFKDATNEISDEIKNADSDRPKRELNREQQEEDFASSEQRQEEPKAEKEN